MYQRGTTAPSPMKYSYINILIYNLYLVHGYLLKELERAPPKSPKPAHFYNQN